MISSGPTGRALLCLALLAPALPESARASFSAEDGKHVVAVFEKELVQPIHETFRRGFKIYFDTTAPFTVPIVAATANRTGQDWNVAIYGAALAHPRLTLDGFVILMCHELGHHFGGLPKRAQGSDTWASIEGQADYYATAVCAKYFFDLIPPPQTAEVTPQLLEARMRCASRITDPAAARLCARSLLASESFMESLKDRDLSWDDSDPQIVPLTVGTHRDDTDRFPYPSDSCRMQTLRHGALCQQIPRPTSDDVLGTSLRNERYCENDRPRCWWAP